VETKLFDEFGAERERRVWLRAFWGFRPEEGGYLGFTREGNRNRFIREYQEGDLVLIYGADQRETPHEQRRQVLGFLDVEPIPVTDVERSSDEDLHRKIENGWRDRWTFAVPVRRAWRVNRKIEVHHFAHRTFQLHNPVLIASRCELLTPEEAKAALALPVTPVNVFGEPPLPPDQLEGEAAIRSFFEPSKGVTPTYGPRSFNVEDEANRLYLLKLEGDVGAFLGRQKYEVARKIVVKVGHAKNPQERCDTHNAHLPPACQFKWKVKLQSKPFSGGEEAKQAEDRLKQRFAEQFESLGREFFIGNDLVMETEFAEVTRAQSFVIAGA
jgi:hypothetical protein